MDDVVICPNCGEPNPTDMAYCHSCQWRLRSLDDAWQSDKHDSAQPSSANSDGSDSVPEWLRLSHDRRAPERSTDESAAQALRERLEAAEPEEAPSAPASRDDSDDLLAGLTRVERPDDEPVPEWVARIMGISDPDGEDESSGNIMQTPQEPAERSETAGASGDWDVGPARTGWSAASHDSGLRPSGEVSPPDAPAASAAQGHERDEIYEWLRKLDAENAAPPMRTAGKDLPATTDVPTWVGRMMGMPGEMEPEGASAGTSLPNWLNRSSEPEAGRPSSIDADHAGAIDQPVIPEPQSDIPLIESVEQPFVEEPDPNRDLGGSPSEQIDTMDVDAVFAAMDMPNWSEAPGSSSQPDNSGQPPAARADEPIEFAELPSWVQAMRPVESAVAPTVAARPETSREPAGPLLGLEGALPAAPDAIGPIKRPQPHTLKLTVADQHRVHARLLEEILDSETRPLPLRGADRAGSSRGLRWIIGVVLLAASLLGLIANSAAFTLPVGVPTESNAAIQVVQSLPADAPVLAIFDYEPATAGEMEAVGASIMDHLLLLKHPRLALISTSPTGQVLAERFISSTLRERAYVRGTQYVDLGFLPGGLSGVQFFAQDPVSAQPFGAATDRVWGSPVLADSMALGDFSAIMLLTDSPESGSVWIEQTTGRRGVAPMVIVASAQAGPLLLPYFDSGQIQGLVVGLNGAAGTELANGGRPGIVRGYWDAYSLGMYLAAACIAMGSTWHVASGILRRRSEAA